MHATPLRDNPGVSRRRRPDRTGDRRADNPPVYPAPQFSAALLSCARRARRSSGRPLVPYTAARRSHATLEPASARGLEVDHLGALYGGPVSYELGEAHLPRFAAQLRVM